MTNALITVEKAVFGIIITCITIIIIHWWDYFYSKKKGIDSNKHKKEKNRETKEYNDEIDISEFVCQELDKFSSGEKAGELKEYSAIYKAGLEGIKNLDLNEINAQKKLAKAMPKSSADEKANRKAMIEIANGKKIAFKAYNKYYKDKQEFVEPDVAVLEKCFEKEDEITERIKTLYAERKSFKKDGDKEQVKKLDAEIKEKRSELKEATKASKDEMDRQAYFNRAAKIYCTARRVLAQEENYKYYDEIAAMYDEATERVAVAKAEREAEQARLEEADRLLKEQLKAEKEAKKQEKKNK
jgi:hypothetical protein